MPMTPKVLIALCGCAFAWLPLQANAQSCWVSGSIGMNFGAISASSPTDSQTSLPFTCGSNSTPLYLRMCLNIGAGSPIADVNPRRMTNYNGAYLQFNLYSDAARTQIIGPQGGGYTEYTWTAQVPGNGGYAQSSGTMPIYGRVFAGQGTVPAGNYQSQLPDIQLRYTWSNSSPPASCAGGSSISIGSPGINANVPSGCRITALSDLDFGTLSAPLSAATDQSASLTLQCPSGTSWQVDLGAGNHNASTRRMSSPAGAYVGYQLYRNAARTQVWGSSVGGTTESGTSTGASTVVPIYGRIPAQAGISSGTYSDIVILTLTY